MRLRAPPRSSSLPHSFVAILVAAGCDSHEVSEWDQN